MSKLRNILSTTALFLVALTTAAGAGTKAQWLFDCTPYYEDKDVNPQNRATMVKIALELEKTEVLPWQIRQFHAYHINSNGDRFDYSYWMLNRSFMFTTNGTTNGWVWHGVFAPVPKLLRI
jgi:hypothetical protein